MTVQEIALSFVEAINTRNVSRLSELMTVGHMFIDSDGSETAGRERMRLGWMDYFAMVPDYRIEVKDVFTRSDTVVLLGFAEGTFSQNGVLKGENHWRVTAAWRAIVSGQGVAMWQVYVNPEPMRNILERIGAPQLPHAAGARGSGDSQA